MEHLNNFNILADIQKFTALLKSKDLFLPVQHLKDVKCAVTVILCVTLETEMKSFWPNESSLLDRVQKADH